MSLIEFKTDLTRSQLRQFAWIWFPLFGSLLGWMLYSRFQMPPAGIALWSLIGLTAIFGIFRPQSVRPVFFTLMCLAFPIGWILSHVVLAIVYYLVITPIGFVMRTVHKDPMQRRFEPDAETYWVERPTAPDKSRYFRQF